MIDIIVGLSLAFIILLIFFIKYILSRRRDNEELMTKNIEKIEKNIHSINGQLVSLRADYKCEFYEMQLHRIRNEIDRLNISPEERIAFKEKIKKMY